MHNPAQALAELIAGMHDAKGRVTLPGFLRQGPKAEQEGTGRDLRACR